MAYVVLAVGALVTLGGLASMIAGYPMIEIERGWATVIAGAVLFSGGLVTMSLGLVLRTLADVGRRVSVGVPRQAAMSDSAPIEAEPPVPSPAPPRASPALTPAFAVAAPAAAAALAADELWPRPSSEARTMPASPSPPQHLDEEPEPQVPAARPVEAWMPQDPEVHPEPEPLPELEPEPEPDPEPVAAAPAAPAASVPHRASEASESREDWLDEAFSAFNYEMATTHAAAQEPAREPEPHHEPPPAEEPEPHEEPIAHHEPESLDPAPAHEDHPPASAEPARQPSPALANAGSPAGDLTVIGRYDSEGTSYVMYSDGSIEAQSEAGVYRFGSMAELKAFIEG